MSNIVFAGASVVAGTGWEQTNHPDHYITLLHKNVPEFSSLNLVNLGIPGTSNAEIFKQATKAITEYNIEYLICSWVSLIRYQFHVGFELYNTEERWSPMTPSDSARGQNLNSVTYTRKYLNNIKDRFLALHHEHYEICKVLEYTSILNKLCKFKNIKIMHVNDSCPWDQDFFTKLENVLPEQYTNFTKHDLLNLSSRSDTEILELYNKMHQDYEQCGGVSQSNWINLYNSFKSLQTDFNHDAIHPGKQSNQTYFNLIKNYLSSTTVA